MIRRRRGERGSVMVEFALVAPLLVLILLGIMVLGVVVNTKIVISGAAREAGRTYAIVKDTGPARAKAADAIRSGGLKFAGEGQVLFDASQDVQFDLQGDYVNVTVTYRQPTFVPLIAEVMGGNGSSGTLPLRSQATFRVER